MPQQAPLGRTATLTATRMDFRELWRPPADDLFENPNME
jgi:hypothetical protein